MCRSDLKSRAVRTACICMIHLCISNAVAIISRHRLWPCCPWLSPAPPKASKRSMRWDFTSRNPRASFHIILGCVATTQMSALRVHMRAACERRGTTKVMKMQSGAIVTQVARNLTPDMSALGSPHCGHGGAGHGGACPTQPL
jgi:hypothetical protein